MNRLAPFFALALLPSALAAGACEPSPSKGPEPAAVPAAPAVSGAPAAPAAIPDGEQPPAAPATSAPVAAATVPAAPPAAPATPPPPSGPEVHFAPDVPWRTWDEGAAEAASSGKPRMLLVYTDWCPKCKALGPLLSGVAFLEAAKGFVLVRQNQDEKPPWLQQYARFGSYVPRILFLRADGTVREDLTSDHPRFPYFYAANKVDRIVAQMSAAAR